MNNDMLLGQALGVLKVMKTGTSIYSLMNVVDELIAAIEGKEVEEEVEYTTSGYPSPAQTSGSTRPIFPDAWPASLG